jgi:GDP-L-fucose synthase
MELNSRIYVAGHRGMVGSAIYKYLSEKGYSNLIVRTTETLDLRDQVAVNEFFVAEKPAYVFLAAAKVGGIYANNTYRAEFIYDNLMIQCNVIEAAAKNNVKKLLFLGSACIYPKLAPQPLKEEYLLTGFLEPTNEPYAIAKIAGIKMCEAYRSQYGCNFISAMPTNLYGTGDNYNLENSHVLPALIRKMHEAKINNKEEVVLWGTGTPRREFLFSEDLASASVFLMENYDGEQFINVGTGVDITISDLADIVKEITGYTGKVVYDKDKPDGTPKRLMDVTLLHNLGWTHKVELRDGIRRAYDNFLTDPEIRK